MSRVTEVEMAMQVEEVAKLISGAPFPSKVSLTKARRVVEFMHTRAPVSVTNDPRVVALANAAQSVLEDSLKHSIHEDVYALRAALANLEKKG